MDAVPAAPGADDVQLTLLRPSEGASLVAGSRINAVGWIESDQPILAVDVRLGDIPLGAARLNIEPGQLVALTGHTPTDRTTGFVLVATVPDTLAGDVALTLRVALVHGAREHSVRVRLAGKPRAAEPEAHAECEEAVLSEDGRLTVKGWAICAGGVAGIDVELDGAKAGTVEPVEDRPDVGARYPGIAGSDRAGFRMAVDLGRRFVGRHTVRVVVRGRAGVEHAVERAVMALPAATAIDAAPQPEAPPIKVFLDAPLCRDGVAVETVRGFLTLTGWALSEDGIDRVEVSVDGQPQGRAHYGVRREDVDRAFPGGAGLLSGFAMIIPPPVMKRGERDVRLCIVAKSGRQREIGFRVRCEKAFTGPGPWALRTKIPASERMLQHAILAARDWVPHWAILIRVASVSRAANLALSQTLESLRYQAYAAWSLVIVTEGIGLETEVEATVARFSDVLGGKVRIVPGEPERLLADLCCARATAIVALRPGDRLGEDALLELSVAGAIEPGADFLYSDERRIDPADGDEKAFFKPDFSPDLLLSTNYIGRLWSASTSLLQAAALREADLWTRGDYHAVLLLTERASRIVHVPKVLCHAAPLPPVPDREREALRAALQRRQVTAEVVPGAVPGSWHIRREVAAGGFVSIIIPTIGARGLIKTTIESIRANTAWPGYEIICVDNLPKTPTAEQRNGRAWFKANADRTVPVREPFNWSRLNNAGAAKAKGQYLLFLNDDVEVRDPQWLHRLVEQAQRPEVGVVGPQLLYPDGRVQHAGMFLGRGAGRHAFRFYARDEPGPFGLALTQRDVISVTGACMLMRREVFDTLGGFDEQHAIVNNDLDFNLRVRRSGWSVLYTPWVSLIHHEMVSRAELSDDHDTAQFEQEWGDLFRSGDPFFSRHLSQEYDDYAPEAEPVQVFTVGHPVAARGEIRRILAVKVDHIGDFVTAFPAFRRIKHCFPEAHLTVLAAKASVALAALEPAIDRVIEFNFFHARSEKGRRAVDGRRLAKLKAQLAPERFDLALDLRRQPETRPVLQASGARWLAGFERGYEHPWLDFTVEFEGDFALKYKHAQIADALVGLVDAVSAGCEPDREMIRPAADRPASEHPAFSRVPGRAFATSLLDKAERARFAGRPLVAIHAGAGAINKQWPAHSFAGLIDLLVGQAETSVAIIGAPDEKAFADGIIALVRHRDRVANLTGRASLADLPRLLSGADLYVGNDSGPKHIAAAIGVPTIGIHSGTVDPGEWGAAGLAAITIRRAMTCSPCYLAYAADCHRGLACLTGIHVGEVFAACRRLLALSRPAPA